MTIRSEQLPSLALAIVLAVGAQTVWFVVGAYVVATVGNHWSHSRAPEELFILRDGTPAIDFHQVDDEDDIFRTLDGKRVKVTERWRQEAKSSILPAFAQQKGQFNELGWSQRLVRLAGPDKYPAAWYFLHDGRLHGRGYFVGYDTKSKLAVGYIGRNGFRPDKPPLDDQFPVDGWRMVEQFGAILFRGFNGEFEDFLGPGIAGVAAESGLQPWIMLLLADDSLMQINVKERTVKCLRKDAHLISAATALKTPTAPETPLSRMLPPQTILFRTPDRVLVTDLNGKEIHTYLLPAELRDLYLQWLQLPDNKVLVRTRHDQSAWDNELFWIDAGGKIVRHEKVDLDRQTRHGSLMDEVGMALIVPCPGAIAGWLACNLWSALKGPEQPGYWVAQGEVFAGTWLLLLVTSTISVVLAWLCYRRQRKYGLPWTWVWTGFVLLFGVPAYLGYLAHRSWPARLACPNCGRLAPRDRPACTGCGREFPPPASKGIEVFA